VKKNIDDDYLFFGIKSQTLISKKAISMCFFEIKMENDNYFIHQGVLRK
jgi:hypothetical protein